MRRYGNALQPRSLNFAIPHTNLPRSVYVAVIGVTLCLKQDAPDPTRDTQDPPVAPIVPMGTLVAVKANHPSASMITLNIGYACCGTTALPNAFNLFALFLHPLTVRGGS